MKRNSLMKNLGLKILALMISFMLWLVVVNISDPVATTTISGISVEVLNSDVITDQGKVYEVLEGTDTITVSVSAKRTVLDSLTKENIKATADLENLDEDGNVRIKVESNRYSESIESIKPKIEYLKVNVEDMAKSQFVITPVITGEIVDGYVVGNITLDENVVRVSGPESVISKISKVVAEVSVSNMSSNIRTSVELKLYDAEDNLISNRNITKNISNVNISVEVLATKEVPINLATSGTPAEGYGLTGVLISDPETILVAGSQTALAKISAINVPDTVVSVEGAIGDVVAAVNLNDYLPDGIQFADAEENGKIVVTAGVSAKETKVVEISRSVITINGMPDSYEASFTTDGDTISAELIAMPDVLEKLDVSTLTAIIDFKAYMEEKEIVQVRESNYVVPVTIQLPEGVELKNPVNISIKVSEKKE
ncbi:MAG: hypothetical protein IJN92_06500 [Lachnospiraceae bacterium]|nr:hypothetical protein [Lachnospiraceae bacterium]